MYDIFSTDYDRFVNWPNRLAFEMPFIEKQLQTLKPLENKEIYWPLSILDVATGTGMHAIELTHRGYQVAGADISPEMIAKARLNAYEEKVMTPFVVAGFGELSKSFVDHYPEQHKHRQRAIPPSIVPFDALFCLGNSLPHLLSKEALATALEDFAACLKPDGLLLLQNRNFDAIMEKRERWMEPQSHIEGDAEWIFLRFYDFDPDELITFNIITLSRKGKEAWQQNLVSGRLYPLLRSELESGLSAAGFSDILAYGGMDGSAFDPSNSGNLVIVARKSATEESEDR